MRQAHTVHDIRAAEKSLMAALPPGTLMQRAAAGLATVCAQLLSDGPGSYGSRVLVVAGGGDNGGDALFAGAALARRGVRVEALLVGSHAHEAGLAALRRCGGYVVQARDNRYDLVVD
ncbi:MAG TPA: NAD(P)H-hydrate epimerase, partial [Nocardioidaceae bacterium]